MEDRISAGLQGCWCDIGTPCDWKFLCTKENFRDKYLSEIFILTSKL